MMTGRGRPIRGYLSDRWQATVAFFLVALSITFGLVALSITFGGGSIAAQGAGGISNPSLALVDYSRSPEAVVVGFTEILGEIGDADRGPSLRIHGDGYAVVHYPHYMKRAGDYALHLSRDEMEDLLRSLTGKKVLEFDAEAARHGKREAAVVEEGLQPTLFAVSDASTTIIEVRLDRYKPAGDIGQEILNVEKKISWYGLRADARQYPNIEAIQNLAAARQELLALMQRQDLERIE